MWKLLSFILRSKQRIRILLSLERPKTPTQISDETKLAISHISRTLKEFKEKGLVICLTPKEKIGKIYKLTDKGKRIFKGIKS